MVPEEQIPLIHSYNDAQLKWFRAGSALNILKSSRKSLINPLPPPSLLSLPGTSLSPSPSQLLFYFRWQPFSQKTD